MAEKDAPKDEPKAEPEDEPREPDWKAEARKWERRAKENVEKARAYDEMEEAGKSELQKAQEEARKAQDRLKEYEAAAARDKAAAAVAKECGVPASLVFGADEDEMRANAEALAEWGKPRSAPKVPRTAAFDAAATGESSSEAARREIASRLFGSQQ